MISGKPEKTDPKTYLKNMTLAVVAGQVGCLTLVIVLAAVLAGLWLDSQFQTRPIMTFVLVIASVPISILVMLAVVRSAVARLKIQPGDPKNKAAKEVTDFGENS
ncbi:MAG: AtpZ/AtpI family protein [Chloroflexi bacterium]|jgi:hypothetical protein|nr:AtpZ/AtpI family protein [Anaerolineaceae bacterium]NMB87257.1 AtpZ/AtpI family protein [Chloroflexota bacterium]